MHKENIVVIFLVSLLLIPAFMAFPESGQSKKILIVKPGDSEPIPTIIRQIKGHLNTQKTDISIEEKIPNTDAEIVEYINKIKPDIVILVGKDIAKYVAANTESTPIVVCDLFTPKYMKSFTDPRIIIHTLDIPIAKRIEYIEKIMLNTKTIGIIYNPQKNSATLDDGEKYAMEQGITLKKFPVSSEKDIQAIKTLDIDVLLLIPDSLICNVAPLRHIMSLCIEQSIPIMGISEYFAQTGTAMAISTNFDDYALHVAQTITLLLEGHDPSTISDQSPVKLDYFINLTMSKRKNITFKDTAIKNATRIYGK